MGNPAFQLIEDRFDDSGAFGTSSFGTSVFGGQDWPPVELSTYHLGSDDLQENHRLKLSEITHYRHNKLVSARPYGDSDGLWDVVFAIIPEAGVVALKPFFKARIFNLLPNGNPLETIQVHWVGEEFHPAYLKPGFYTLAFQIQEFEQ